MPARARLLRLMAPVLVWLLVGAAVNVAMAWGLAANAQFRTPHRFIIIDNRKCDTLFSQWPGCVRVVWEFGTVNWWRTTPETMTPDVFKKVFPEWASLAECRSVDAFHHLMVIAGWPKASVHCTHLFTLTPDHQVLHEGRGWVKLPKVVDPKGRAVTVPWLPLWPGFAVNTAFYAGLLWMLWATPFGLRRMIRKRRGLCVKCAYPAGPGDVCTECGAALAPRVQAPRP